MKTKHILVIFLTAILVFFAIRVVKTRTIKNPEMFPMQLVESRIFIPVEIDGKVFNFLFDTGSMTTSVEANIYNNTDIQLSNKTQSIYLKQTEKIHTANVSKKKRVCFADKSMACRLNVFLDVDSIDSADYGIIGENIISRFNWFFDFSENQYAVIDRERSFKTNNEWIEATSYEFTFFNGMPRLKMCLNDNDTLDLFLDTGCQRMIVLKYSVVDVLLTSTVYSVLNIGLHKEADLSIEQEKYDFAHVYNVETYNSAYLKQPKINNVSHPSMMVSLTKTDSVFYEIVEQVPFYNNNLSASYLSYFDACYFDLKNNKLRLYFKKGSEKEKTFYENKPNEVDKWFNYLMSLKEMV